MTAELSRAQRRRRVLIIYGMWLVATVIAETVVLATTPKGFSVVILLFVDSIAVFGFFHPSTIVARAVLSSDAGLDERLVRNRLVAFRSAYRAFAVFVMAAWPLSALLIMSSPDLNSDGPWTAFVLWATGSLLVVTLPTAWWMWQEPDPVA